MADIKEMRIFSADQIIVPDDLPAILKNYSKEVIRKNPADIIKFSREYTDFLKYRYFEELHAKRQKEDPSKFPPEARR